ncbi:MAG: sigma-70 family RNA polymerase sigma factor [Verrucomicrobia bacterium]|nr:sigma-70 family RNA polymerase sigma factor [Verrucomicrobiota bacterium]
MQMPDGVSEGDRAFPTTHWSQIYLASEPEQAAGFEALDQVLHQYQGPLRRHLQRKFHRQEADIEDWLQGFMAERILAKALLQRADADRGRFRTFLLKALDHYVIDRIRQENKNPLGRPPTDPPPETPVQPAPGLFDRDWARHVIEQACVCTRRFYESKGRAGTWTVFDATTLLDRDERPSSSELAKRHGFASGRQVDNAIITAKREFGKQLRLVVAQYVRTEVQIDEEIHNLIEMFAQG